MAHVFRRNRPSALADRLLPHRGHAIGLFLVVLSGAGATALAASLAGPLVAAIAGGETPAAPGPLAGLRRALGSETRLWAALFLAAAVFRALAGTVAAVGTAGLQQDVARDLRRWLFERALEGSAHQRNEAADRAARAAGDVQTLATAVNHGLFAFLRNVTTAAALLGVVAWLRPIAGLVAGLGVLAVLAGTVRAARTAARVWRTYWSGAGGLAVRLAEVVEAAPVARAFGAVPQLRGRFEGDLAATRREGVRAVRRHAWIAPTVGFAGAAALALAAVVLEDREARWPWSVVVALVFLWRPVTAFASSTSALAAGLAAYERLAELAAGPGPGEAQGPTPASVATPGDAEALPPAAGGPVGFSAGRIEVRIGEQRILRLEDLAVHAGALVAISGPNGAGKSTLVHALVGAVPALVDAPALDGSPVPPAAFHRAFAWVPQDPVLWSGTIRENLGPSGDDRGDGRGERLREALRWSGLSALDDAGFPLDRELGVRGAPLSAGQKQRVALARALASPAPILVLDEPFSALDELTAEDLEAVLHRLRGQRTMLVVTHRRSVLEAADHRIALDGGCRLR